MGFLWHSPSEGSLSYPFTNYTHNTSYRPNARGGPSSYFSQSLELCVGRQANISHSGSRLPDFTRICQLLGLRCTVCISDKTDEMYRKFLGLRCVLIWAPSYPTTHVVAVTYLVCVYLLYGGPITRTLRIVNFLVCVVFLFGHLVTRQPT